MSVPFWIQSKSRAYGRAWPSGNKAVSVEGALSARVVLGQKRLGGTTVRCQRYSGHCIGGNPCDRDLPLCAN